MYGRTEDNLVSTIECRSEVITSLVYPGTSQKLESVQFYINLTSERFWRNGPNLLERVRLAGMG